MKSTYSLIGVEWDKYPIPKSMPEIIEFQPNLQDIHTEYNLFDINLYQRSVSLSEIWNMPFQDLNLFLKKAMDCESVYLVIDNVPRHLYPVVAEYYILRMLQVLNYVTSFYAGKKVKVIGEWGKEIDNNRKETIKKVISSYRWGL